jgi:hypothetical protein
MPLPRDLIPIGEGLFPDGTPGALFYVSRPGLGGMHATPTYSVVRLLGSAAQYSSPPPSRTALPPFLPRAAALE